MIHETGKISKVYSYCIDCDFRKTKYIYEIHLNYYLEELSADDLPHYYVLKNLNGSANNNAFIKMCSL